MLTDAFGIVAMVAMTPLLTIQALGLIYKHRQKAQDAAELITAADEDEDEDEIIVIEEDETDA